MAFSVFVASLAFAIFWECALRKRPVCRQRNPLLASRWSCRLWYCRHENPAQPEITLRTHERTVDECVEEILDHLVRQGFFKRKE